MAERARDAPAEASPRPRDPASVAWIERLGAGGREQDAALAELHALLVKAARFALAARRSSQAGLDRDVLDELAVEAADDALVSILAHLDDFRGESRFTTWAWKFGFFEACVAIRKRRWLGREVPLEAAGWDALRQEAGPDGTVEQRELLAALKQGVDDVLTPYQRRAFVALALNKVPVDVLAERLGTTRGALYKSLHEARKRLRDHLACRGLLPDAWDAPRPKRRLRTPGLRRQR